MPPGLSVVRTIYSNEGAFAALGSNGNVTVWGATRAGGSVGTPADVSYYAGAPEGLSSVIIIYSNAWAFAALKEDGSVEAWGDSSYGGTEDLEGLGGVKVIFSTEQAFAALLWDCTRMGQ